MSEDVTGLALKFGPHPVLQWVENLGQAAKLSKTTPTMLVIGGAQGPHAFEDAHRFSPGSLLKEACALLLEELRGRRGASKSRIRRLKNSDALEDAYARYASRAKGRSPLEPTVMFIESMRASAFDAAFEARLQEALKLLNQVVVPTQTPPVADDGEQLQLARKRRAQLLAHEKWFNAPEVHEQQGGNPSAQGVNNTASRARGSGGLLGAWDGREYLHPRCQFDLKTGRLMPEMKQLLDILPRDRSGWRQTFWLFQKHAQLAGRRPADVFQKDPAAVIEAARSDFVPDDERW